jgi:protein involved in polysaccharide export with SLBB domain
MRQISILFTVLGFLAPQLRADPAVTIRPGDVFDMRVTGIPNDVAVGDGTAALQYTIGQDGIVNVPLLGKIKIAGLTSSQAEDQIQAKYVAGKIYTNPVIIISVQQAQVQRSVTIGGGVKGPGKQLWSSDLTLGSAIDSAGGLNDFGSPKGVKVVRDGKILGTFDLREIRKDPSKDVKLLAGDQVIVKE